MLINCMGGSLSRESPYPSPLNKICRRRHDGGWGNSLELATFRISTITKVTSISRFRTCRNAGPSRKEAIGIFDSPIWDLTGKWQSVYSLEKRVQSRPKNEKRSAKFKPRFDLKVEGPHFTF